MKTDFQKLYDEAFRLLGKRTPLKTDCGVLCEKSCCRGDEKTGMLLFPFEKTTLRVEEKDGVRLAVCSGSCERDERPLSCRIFPFFPTVSDDGKITVSLDYRGFFSCPLVRHCDDVRFSFRFLHRVRLLGELLSADEDCLDFLKEVTKEIEFEKALLETKGEARRRTR